MTEQQNIPNRKATLTAHIISGVFSPLFAPTYAMAMTLWLTNLRYLPSGVLIWALSGILLITCILPAALIYFLIRKGKVSDFDVSNPRQRGIPFTFATICYIAAAVFVFVLNAPGWMPAFFIGAAIVSGLSMLISKWWKISAHSASVGGVTALIYWLVYQSYLNIAPMMWLSITIIVTGLVGWARLYLRHHTPAQVFAGAILAFIVELATVACLQA